MYCSRGSKTQKEPKAENTIDGHAEHDLMQSSIQQSNGYVHRAGSVGSKGLLVGTDVMSFYLDFMFLLAQLV